MAQFVHLTTEDSCGLIRRNGIQVSRMDHSVGVYAFPQIENFVVTHQWMRELKRFKSKPMVAVRFRIYDHEQVSIGKFNSEYIDVTASEAIAIAREHIDPLGLEVFIPRKIQPKEIIAFYSPPKVTGWRYYPNAKGKEPCGCSYCQRGMPFSRKLRERYENDS